MAPTFDQLPSAIQELTNLITSIYADVIDIKFSVLPPKDEVLGVDEAAAFLKCKPSTIYRIAREGKVKSFIRLKKRYFFKNDLVEYLKNGFSQSNDDGYVKSNILKTKKK